MRIDDTQGNVRGWVGDLEPYGRTTLFLSFDTDPFPYSISTLPPPEPLLRIGGFKRFYETTPFDFSKIKNFRVYSRQLTTSRTLYFDRLRLVPGKTVLERLTGISDMFGQNAKLDWPSKTRSIPDMIEHRETERAWLDQNPPLPDRDAYGGSTLLPKVTATGYFRTEKVGSSWWLVTPAGSLFWAAGMGTIEDGFGANETLLTGREYMFNWLPSAGDPNLRTSNAFSYGPVKTGLAYSFYRANLMRKFGTDFFTPWINNTRRRLQSWGMNSIGSASSDAAIEALRVPFTVTFRLSGSYATIDPGWITQRALPDPYDPLFRPAIESLVGATTLRYRNDPLLIGYYIGNEDAWSGGPTQEESGRYGIATGVLNLLASKSPAKREFLNQLKAKYPNVAGFNAAWGTSLASWAALDSPFVVANPSTADAKVDMRALISALAERYFSTFRTIIKGNDPNHMILGMRIAANKCTPEVIQAAANSFEVLSVNLYEYRFDPAKIPYYAYVDKPFIVSEFNSGALDMGATFHGNRPVQTQADRAIQYREYMLASLAQPNVVGASWWKYNDPPVTGTSWGESVNSGFVDIADYPSPELAVMARSVNTNLYSLRPVPAQPTVLALTLDPVLVGDRTVLRAQLTTRNTPIQGQTIRFSLSGVQVGTAATDSQGRASLSYKIEDGPAGLRPVVARFDATSAYQPSQISGDLDVRKSPTQLIVDPKESRIDGIVNLSATLSRTSDLGRLDGRRVVFEIDGVEVGSTTTDVAGVARLAWQVQAEAGAHTIRAVFAEDAAYLATFGVAQLTIRGPAATTLTLAPVAGRIGESVTLVATLASGGVPIPNQTVGFLVDGATAGTAVTNADGRASLEWKIKDGPAGIRPTSATFSGSADWSASQTTSSLEVLKAPTGLAVDPKEARDNGSVRLTATLSRTTDLEPLKDRTVAFEIDGVQVGTATTNAAGVAGLNWKVNVGVGPHTIRAFFVEDDSYLSSEGTAPLTITGPAVTALVVDPASARIGETANLVATLSSEGAPLPGQTLSFSVEGTPVGTAQTDAEGKATVPYKVLDGPAGPRAVHVQFLGNDDYAPSSGDNALEVLKAPTALAVDPKEARDNGSVRLTA
ncbi:MAG: Ig-like domain repeat protein, partial [Fimbriimonas sp.]